MDVGILHLKYFKMPKTIINEFSIYVGKRRPTFRTLDKITIKYKTVFY